MTDATYDREQARRSDAIVTAFRCLAPNQTTEDLLAIAQWIYLGSPVPAEPQDGEMTGADYIQAHESEAIPLREGQEEPDRCTAHGVEACSFCSRIEVGDDDGNGGCRSCGTYEVTGMHWDTCPHRIRGPIASNRTHLMAIHLRLSGQDA